MNKRIMRTWEQATPQQRRMGAMWYPRAYGVACVLASRGDCTIDAAVAVLAHLSPRAQWVVTIRGAFALVTTGQAPGLMGANVARAKAAMGSPAPLDTINGPKTRSFAANILGDFDQVTVDVWALRVARGSSADAALIRRQDGYDDIVNEYREVAKRVGQPAAVVQATTWIVARNGRDA